MQTFSEPLVTHITMYTYINYFSGQNSDTAIFNAPYHSGEVKRPSKSHKSSRRDQVM